MIGPTDKEFDTIFDIICLENNIKNKNLLKLCIHDVITNYNNDYLSFREYEYHKAIYDNFYDDEIENFEDDEEIYKNIIEYEIEYYKALSENKTNKIKNIITMYNNKID